jgi:folate-binding protein YgfZ
MRGEVLLDASLTDQFLPQELNLDILAGVSFNKGCYPGQEIIARVKFRGTVKRRVQRVHSATSLAAATGAPLVGADDARHGTVLTSTVNAAGSCEALAVIDLDAGALHLAGDARAAVDILALPYTLTGA